MKKYTYILSSWALALASLLCAACSSEEVFEPGPAVPQTCQGVHFALSEGSTAMLIAAEPERTALFTVKRNLTSGAISVPVRVISKADGLVIPGAVDFADGEATTLFAISTPQDVEAGTSFEFEVELEGDNVNPYTEGATRFSGTVAFPKSRIARMNFTNAKAFMGYMRQEFYDLGNGRLIARNFLESGTDVTLIYDKDATETVDCTVTTSPSYVEADDTYAGCNYVWCWDEKYSDDADHNYGYTTFYPHGRNAKTYISSLCLYYGDEWSVYNPTSGDGWIGISEIQFSTRENTNYWEWLNFKFVDEATDEETDYSEPDPTSLPVGTVLNCTASLNYDDFGLGSFSQTGVVVGKNYVRFDDFVGSGKKVTFRYNADGTTEVFSDYGYVENGVWYFRDKATGEWYGGSVGGHSLSLSISLTSEYNYIDYSKNAMMFHSPQIVVDGQVGEYDDYLMLKW